MSKTVLKFGLISGVMMAAFMWATLPFIDRLGMNHSFFVGYAGMVVAFLMVFFGIRAYRETEGGGYITFLRGLAIGLLIAFISSALYVASWEVLSHNFMPNFIDNFVSQAINQMKEQGKPQSEIDAKTKEMADFKKMYANPFYNVLLTIIEPLPVGILIAFISALILRRRRPIPDPPLPPAYA